MKEKEKRKKKEITRLVFQEASFPVLNAAVLEIAHENLRFFVCFLVVFCFLFSVQTDREEYAKSACRENGT